MSQQNRHAQNGHASPLHKTLSKSSEEEAHQNPQARALLADPSDDVRPSDYYCNARTRHETAKYPYCHHRAGANTDHTGTGRCWLHGGRSLKGAANGRFKHGRYSTIASGRIKDLIDTYRDDDAPLDLKEEVFLLRALTHDLIERWEDIYGEEGALMAWHDSWQNGRYASKPKQLPDLSALHSIVDAIGKMVERIQRHDAERSMTYGQLSAVMKALGSELGKTLTELDVSTDLEAKIVERVATRWAHVPILPDRG